MLQASKNPSEPDINCSQVFSGISVFYFRVSHLAPPDRREVSSYIEKLRLAEGMVKKTDGSSVKTAMRLRHDSMADPSAAVRGEASERLAGTLDSCGLFVLRAVVESPRGRTPKSLATLH